MDSSPTAAAYPNVLQLQLIWWIEHAAGGTSYLAVEEENQQQLQQQQRCSVFLPLMSLRAFDYAVARHHHERLMRTCRLLHAVYVCDVIPYDRARGRPERYVPHRVEHHAEHRGAQQQGECMSREQQTVAMTCCACSVLGGIVSCAV